MASGILSYDVWAIATGRPTMTQVFGEALEHPLRRWPTTLAWSLTTAHLFGRYLPERLHKYDPFMLVGYLAALGRRPASHEPLS